MSIVPIAHRARPFRCPNWALSVGAIAAGVTWSASVAAAPTDGAEAPEGTKSKSVALLPLMTLGEMPEFEQEQVRAQISTNIESDAITLVGPEQTRTSLQELGLPSCTQASCMAQIGQRHDATYVVQATIDASTENEYGVELRLHDGSSGEPIETFADSCTICGQAELVRLVREVTLDMASKLQRLEKTETKTKTGTEPEPEPEPEPCPPTKAIAVPPSPLIVAGAAMVGAGAASTIGGVALIAMHQRSAGCLDDPRGGECLPIRYTTLLPGAILAGVGVAVLGTGIGLLIAGKNRQERDLARVGRVSIHADFGPGSVLVRGRF